MKIWNLYDAFWWELGTLSDGIQQFLEVHEELAACATNPDLVRGLRRHLKRTEQQAMNLDRIAEALNEQYLTVTNHAARGIARGVRESIDAAQTPHVRDWVVAMAVDTIGRAEIARYTALRAMAQRLELPAEVAELLRQNLTQDEQAVDELAQLAPRLLQVATQPQGA